MTINKLQDKKLNNASELMTIIGDLLEQKKPTEVMEYIAANGDLIPSEDKEKILGQLFLQGLEQKNTEVEADVKIKENLIQAHKDLKEEEELTQARIDVAKSA